MLKQLLQSEGARARRWGLGGLGLGLLLVLTSQLRCAEVADGWNMNEPGNGDGGQNGDGGDGGGDDGVHCYTGTPTSELLLFNKCTEADHVDRASHIPKTTWDGTSPLPFTQ